MYIFLLIYYEGNFKRLSPNSIFFGIDMYDFFKLYKIKYILFARNKYNHDKIYNSLIYSDYSDKL